MAEELLVFGYSCKLFQDDEKALHIDQGKHLVPWMNDHNLRIDRFDVRGALYDLREAEAHGSSQNDGLTEGQRREEQVCDHERYLALYHDEQHELLCQEEETKRIQVELQGQQSGYKQIAFDYDNVNSNEGSSVIIESPAVVDAPVAPVAPAEYNPADDDLFFPPPELNITMGLEVPTSKKQNKVIVKTAQFVVNEGVQMEILLKTKQNGNPMFNFLAFDNCLNPYYKHVVNMIKKGRYRPYEETEEKDQNGQAPSNMTGVRPNLTPGVSSPNRPPQNCTYSNLISKIREKQKASCIDEVDTLSPIAPSSPVDRSSNSAEVMNFPNTPVNTHPPKLFNPPPPPPLPLNSAENTRHINSTPLPLNATPVSSNGRPALVGLVDYPSFNQTAEGGTSEEDEPVAKVASVRESAHDYSHIKWPPPDVQMVVDKMASYIIKNGDVFEQTVKAREDPRFNFLILSNEYYPYYQCKMELYREVYGDIFRIMAKQSPESKQRPLKSGIPSIQSPPNAQNHNGRTISFSIKSRDSENTLTSHSTFPVESSTSEEDDDMPEDEKEKRRIEREKRREKRRQKLREEKRLKEREEKWRREKEENEERLKKSSNQEEDDGSSENEDLYDIFKYAQEMSQEKADSPISQSPDLSKGCTKQSERKKKAAAFLSKLKGTDDEPAPTYGPDLPPEIAASLNPPLSRSPTSSSSESLHMLDSTPSPKPKEKTKTRSPSPLGLIEGLSTIKEKTTSSPSSPKVREEKFKLKSSRLGLVEALTSSNFTSRNERASRDSSVSVRRSRSSSKETESTSMGSILLKGLRDRKEGKSIRERSKDRSESLSHKSRSHKKHSRYRSRSRSVTPSPKRKKRKRSRSRKRKKHRSRSREKKKHRKQKSHRDSKKRKKKRAKTPLSSSSSSSLPSSDDSSSDILPSESDEINIVEDSTPTKDKSQSRSSSVLSVHDKTPDRESLSAPAAANPRSTVDTEDDNSSPPVMPLKLLGASLVPKLSKSSLTPLSDAASRDGSKFDPSKSQAMAKIAQGLRAKLNAIFEKESNVE